MSSPFAKPDEPKEISEVNVVPLADVSLVLLIILLVLSPMLRQNMLPLRAAADSTAPETPSPVELLAPQVPELVLVVSLAQDAFAVGARRFTDSAAFSEHLRGLLNIRGDKKVFLEPRPEVSVGAVVRALETIKACGAESVALVQVQEAPK
jgi:biopolymer transport protein ExbD